MGRNLGITVAHEGVAMALACCDGEWVISEMVWMQDQDCFRAEVHSVIDGLQFNLTNQIRSAFVTDW